jgi:hypothetical protein
MREFATKELTTTNSRIVTHSHCIQMKLHLPAELKLQNQQVNLTKSFLARACFHLSRAFHQVRFYRYYARRHDTATPPINSYPVLTRGN